MHYNGWRYALAPHDVLAFVIASAELKTKIMFKAGKTRYSEYHKRNVRDIYKRSKLFGLIPYWRHNDTIIDAGQVDEVVMLLNNPSELKSRLENAKKAIM